MTLFSFLASQPNFYYTAVHVANVCSQYKFFGSGALPGKMLPVRIIENNKIDAHFRSG